MILWRSSADSGDLSRRVWSRALPIAMIRECERLENKNQYFNYIGFYAFAREIIRLFFDLFSKNHHLQLIY